MNCAICRHGQTALSRTTVFLQRGEASVIIKDVPAEVCENCGEYYLSEAITEKVLALAEEAVKMNTEVAVIRFAA